MKNGRRCDVLDENKSQFKRHYEEVHFEDVSEQLKAPEHAINFRNGVPIGVGIEQYCADPTPGGDHGQWYEELLTDEGSVFRCNFENNFTCTDQWDSMYLLGAHMITEHNELLDQAPEDIKQQVACIEAGYAVIDEQVTRPQSVRVSKRESYSSRQSS